jgi:hypothetical protein
MTPRQRRKPLTSVRLMPSADVPLLKQKPNRRASVRRRRAARRSIVNSMPSPNAIDAAKAESEAAKRELTAAGETGDWAKVADAQEKIGTAAAKMVRLGEARSELEFAKKTPPKPDTARTAQRSARAVHRFASCPGADLVARPHERIDRSTARRNRQRRPCGSAAQGVVGRHTGVFRAGRNPARFPAGDQARAR